MYNTTAIDSNWDDPMYFHARPLATKLNQYYTPATLNETLANSHPNRCTCEDCNCKFDTKNANGVCKSCTNGNCHPQKKGA